MYKSREEYGPTIKKHNKYMENCRKELEDKPNSDGCMYCGKSTTDEFCENCDKIFKKNNIKILEGR